MVTGLPVLPGLDERRAEKVSMSWAPERLSQGSSMVGMEKHLWRPPAPAPAQAGTARAVRAGHIQAAPEDLQEIPQRLWQPVPVLHY